VWNPIRKDVIVSRDVVFDEHIPSQVAIINVEPGSDDISATSKEVTTIPQARKTDKDTDDETNDEREFEPEARLPSSSGTPESKPMIRRSSRSTKGQVKSIPYHKESWSTPRSLARIARA
jgi:hypothetical protein